MDEVHHLFDSKMPLTQSLLIEQCKNTRQAVQGVAYDGGGRRQPGN